MKKESMGKFRKIKVLLRFLCIAFILLFISQGNLTLAEEVTDQIKILEENGQKISCVSLGYSHEAALTESGDLYCWGNNNSGQVGNGTTKDQTTPIKILDNISSVFLFGYNSAAITKNGDLYCWGNNNFGQVGNGTTENQTTPIKILDNVSYISFSECHSAAITKDGNLYCWGYNNLGQVGNRTTKIQTTPMKVLSNISFVSITGDVNSANSAAITNDGDLYCWGCNRYGQVGNGTTENQTTPVRILSNVSDISLSSCGNSYNYSAAVTRNGDLYCWGYNKYGQVGNGTTKNQTIPMKILSGVSNVYLSEPSHNKGFAYSAAVTRNGDLYCWGYNEYGQIGNGTTEIQVTPVKILDNISSVCLVNHGNGSTYTAVIMAITNNQELYSWGCNRHGYIGNGTTEIQMTPVKILEDIAYVSMYSYQFGNCHIAALKTNGELYSWGYNRYGQVGNGTTEIQTLPIKIMDNVESVTLSSSNPSINCESVWCTSITTNGDLYGWGSNYYGQIGNGTRKEQVSPIKILPEDFLNCIVIDEKAKDMEGCTIALSGTLTLEESIEASKENLQKVIDSLKFESSDDSKAKVLSCNAVESEDHRSATLEIWTTLYNKGTATITVTATDGHTSKCEITIAENISEDTTNYEGDYTSEMREFLSNKGTLNTLEYLCNDVNFTASTFVAERDAQMGELLVKYFTNVFYRGWDGWRDLIDGSTSVEEAEKIIASLLNAYQVKLESLSKAKTAQKYAKMLNNAFSDYSKASNFFKAMHSDEIEVVRKYFDESNLARLLYEGKYDEIAAPVNQILQQVSTQSEVFKQESWKNMMESFIQSGEVSKVLKEGCKGKLGKLEIGGGLSDIGDALNLISFAQDTVNYLYQLESLLTTNEMYCEMLLYIQKNCAYDVVQKAAGNLYSVINDGIEGILSDISVKAINSGGEKILDKALEIACKSSLPFTIIKAGFDWGATLSNTFFKTGKTQELKDSLRSQAFLANCLGAWVQSNAKDYLSSVDTNREMEKGKELYYSLYMLWESRKNAEETLQNLLKTTNAELSANYSVSTKISSTLESFQNNIFVKKNIEILLGISVSCPVDVEVYDENGVKLLIVKDGTECQGYEKGIYYYCVYNPLADDYDKYIYYSEDKNYNVKIVGNDLGLSDCSVSRVNNDGYLSEFYFENKEIDKGTVIDLCHISQESVDYKITNVNGNETSNSMGSRKADKLTTDSILLNINLLELTVGEKQLLTVSFTPANATNQKVIWDSSNDDVVSVNNDGVIIAKTVGTAVITVSQGNLEQKCKIIVKENLLGDVNGDDDINSTDALIALKIAASLIEPTEDQEKVADVNKDNIVNSLDALLILKYAAKLIDKF